MASQECLVDVDMGMLVQAAQDDNVKSLETMSRIVDCSRTNPNEIKMSSEARDVFYGIVADSDILAGVLPATAAGRVFFINERFARDGVTAHLDSAEAFAANANVQKLRQIPDALVTFSTIITHTIESAYMRMHNPSLALAPTGSTSENAMRDPPLAPFLRSFPAALVPADYENVVSRCVQILYTLSMRLGKTTVTPTLMAYVDCIFVSGLDALCPLEVLTTTYTKFSNTSTLTPLCMATFYIKCARICIHREMYAAARTHLGLAFSAANAHSDSFSDLNSPLMRDAFSLYSLVTVHETLALPASLSKTCVYTTATSLARTFGTGSRKRPHSTLSSDTESALTLANTFLLKDEEEHEFPATQEPSKIAAQVDALMAHDFSRNPSLHWKFPTAPRASAHSEFDAAPPIAEFIAVFFNFSRPLLRDVISKYKQAYEQLDIVPLVSSLYNVHAVYVIEQVARMQRRIRVDALSRLIADEDIGSHLAAAQRRNPYFAYSLQGDHAVFDCDSATGDAASTAALASLLSPSTRSLPPGRREA